MRCPVEHTREARPASVAVNVGKTLLQIVAFWGFFLVVTPAAIMRFERFIGISSFANDALRLFGIGLFLILGAIGLYCGMIFAVLGSGTPLPLNTTTKLVIVGPYRYVRNPMALTGTFQGVAVGLYFGSPLTIVYSVAGMFAWNLLARRWEEENMARRFGEPYERYRAAIP